MAQLWLSPVLLALRPWMWVLRLLWEVGGRSFNRAPVPPASISSSRQLSFDLFLVLASTEVLTGRASKVKIKSLKVRSDAL